MQTPDPNPEFPSYNDPLPPPPPPFGTQPEAYAAQPQYAPGGYQRPPRGPVVSFDTIGEAWNVLSPNLGTWVAMILVQYVITSLPWGVFYALNLPTIIAQAKTNPNAPPAFGLTYYVSALVVYVLVLTLSAFMGGGMVRAALHNVRTGRVDFGMLFSATDVLPSLLGAIILIILACYAGGACCVVPGLLLAGLFMFTFPLIVDKRMGAIEAMRTSFNAVKPQMWMALVYVFVLSIIAQAGVLACCVGLFVTVPLAVIALTISYEDFFSGGTRTPPAANYPTAPLADPNG